MQGFLKESGIYFDTEPKRGSNNAVTSDGIYKTQEIYKTKKVNGSTVWGGIHTFTIDCKGKSGFIILGGWSYGGTTFRNLYFLSYNQSSQAVIKLIASELCEAEENPVTAITASRSENIITIEATLIQNFNSGNGIEFKPF